MCVSASLPTEKNRKESASSGYGIRIDFSGNRQSLDQILIG